MVEMRTPTDTMTATTPSAYVETAIPKVSETPLGNDSFTGKEFGPFECDDNSNSNSNDSATMEANGANKKKKGHSVHFVASPNTTREESSDPIEKAIDSVFYFYDDVREAGNTFRENGTSGCGSGVDFRDTVSNRLGPESEFAQTMECVTEGLCRNPCADSTCVDSCTNLHVHMPPPADLMLTVTDEHQNQPKKDERKAVVSDEAVIVAAKAAVESTTAQEETKEEQAPAPTPAPIKKKKKVEFLLCKDNSVRDMSPDVEEETEVAMPTYTPVETVVDKMRTMVPEDIVTQLVDAFAEQYGDVKPFDSSSSPEEAKSSGGEDPVVEAIDSLILFFDDLQENLLKQKDAFVKNMEEVADATSVAAAEAGKAALEAANAAVESANAAASGVDFGTGSKTVNDAPPTIEETPIAKIKPMSAKMSADEYAEALESVAGLLSQSAPEDESQVYTKEELHQKALEKIMGERDDSFSESEYKTEEMLLNELMYDAEQAILSARSQSSEEKAPEDALIVLGHSATLTPILEADEGSTSPETIQQVVVMSAAAPEVPLAPSAVEEEATINVVDTVSVQEEIKVEEAIMIEEEIKVEDAIMEENIKKEVGEPLITKVIDGVFDGIFLYYDDIEQKRVCTACLGSSVPSDLIDPVDEIVAGRGSAEMQEEEPKPAAPKVEPMERMAKAFAVEPTPEPVEVEELSEGQRMLEQALLLVQEASKPADKASPPRSDDDLRIGRPQPVAEAKTDPVSSFMDQIQRATASLMGMKDAIAIARSDGETSPEVIDLVDAAYKSDDEQKLLSQKQQAPTSTTTTTTATGSTSMHTKVALFDIPAALVNAPQPDPYAWGGDDSELMASINADRKFSEMEHVNIFRDVSSTPGQLDSAGNAIDRTQAFTAGNSSSGAELADASTDPVATQAALKALSESTLNQ